MLAGLHGSRWFDSSPDASRDVSSLLSSRTSLPRRIPVDLLVERRSNQCVAGSIPPRLGGELRKTVRPTLSPGPQKGDHTRRMRAGLQDRATGNRRGAVQLCAPRNQLAHGYVLPNLVAGPKQNNGANAEGTTAQNAIWRAANPTRRPGFGTDRTVSSPLSPRSRLPRRMPCGTTVILRSRVQIPPRPTRRVAQSGRAQERVANPLSPGQHWRVAQLVERRVLVPMVEGSNPSPPAKNNRGNAGRTTGPNSGAAQSLVPRTKPNPGEYRAALQPVTLVVAGSNPAAPSTIVGA
jgi:hypothetical protein